MQVLGKLAAIVSDRRIGQQNDFGPRAIIGFQVKLLRVRVAFFESVDVGEVRTAPSKYGLGVVAYDHDVAVLGGEQVDDLSLYLVGVLILVNEDVFKVTRPVIADFRLFDKQPLPVHQQVVVIHGVALELARLKEAIHALNLRRQRLEVRIVGDDAIAYGQVAVVGIADDVGDDFGLGKAARFHIDAGVLYRGFDETLGVFGVEDGEVMLIVYGLGVAAQDAIGDGMKGAAPDFARVGLQQRLDAVEHLARRFVGKRHEQNVRRRHAHFDEPRDAISHRARLA